MSDLDFKSFRRFQLSFWLQFFESSSKLGGHNLSFQCLLDSVKLLFNNNRLFINKLFWSLGCKDNCMKSFDCFSLFSNMFNFLEIQSWLFLSNPSRILSKNCLKIFWCFYGIPKALLTQNRWTRFVIIVTRFEPLRKS